MKKYLFVICALLVVVAGCSGGTGSVADDTTSDGDADITDNRFGWGDISSSDDEVIDDDGYGGYVGDDDDGDGSGGDVTRVKITGSVTKNVYLGNPVSGEITATGGSGEYTWKATSYPTWLIFEPEGNKATISGNGTAAGEFKIKVRACDASDDDNCSYWKTYRFTVNELHAYVPLERAEIDPCYTPLKISVVEYTKNPTVLPGCGTNPDMPGCTTLSEVSPNVAILAEETITVKFRAGGKGPFVWSLNSFVEDLFPGEFCPPGMPGCGEENESAFDASVSSSVPDSGTNDLFTVRGRFMRGMPMTSPAIEGEPGPSIGYLGETLNVKVSDECSMTEGSSEKRTAEKNYRFRITTPTETIAGSDGVHLLVEIRYNPGFDDGFIEFYDAADRLVAKTGELDYPGYVGENTFVVPVKIVNGVYASYPIESIKKIRFVDVDNDFEAVRIFSRYRHFYYDSGISSDRTVDAVWQISGGANAFCVPEVDLDEDGDDDTSIMLNHYNEVMPDECALEPL